MRENNFYFFKIWLKTMIILILFTCLFTFKIYNNYKNGDIGDVISTVIATVISIVATAGFLYFKMNKNKNYLEKEFKKGLQSETSAELLKYYDNVFTKPMPTKDKDAWLIYLKCTICCYYGEFDKVIQMLNEINWNDRIPYIQSLEISIKALMHYLKSEDCKEGLRLSKLAQELASISIRVPGNRKSQNSYEVYILVGEIFTENIDSNIIELLEDKYDDAPTYVKLLIAYCLSKVYMKINMIEKAEEKIQYCKQVAPHCKLLFN